MILRELQKKFGEIYFGGKKISTDMFFILENITANCQMDASEFKGVLFTMLSEEPFSNHRLDMNEVNEEYTISDYVSQNFAITIGETWTCLTCNVTKSPKIFKDFAFILPLEKNQRKEEIREKSVTRKRLIWGRVV